MRNLMKKYEEEDTKILMKKKVEIERSKQEVILENEKAIARKKQLKLQEQKEIENILIYQAMKDAELAKREAEEIAIEKLKKERQAKLLAEQERVRDNADKLDELRARRAAEEKERNERMKEKQDALKKKAELDELKRSREEQAKDKQRVMMLQKQQETQEFLQTLKHSQKLEERERLESLEKQRKVQEFRDTLTKQIDEIARLRKLQKNPSAENAASLHEQLIREEERLKVIRDRMVKDLESQGVNPKYLTEMKSVDIGRILRR
jgi:hypothetical protein